MQIQSASDVIAKINQDPAFAAAVKENPAAAIAEVASNPLQTDRLIYRMVVGALGLTMLLSLIGIFIMAFYGKLIPEGAIALGSAAVGAVAGLLAPSPSRG
ncbi:MAG TPA: hypothetical protein PLL77_10845 [Pyrinomonadaceae bacterium]|nr:hypothetical protein [Pyrinomonadaceae bacterium]